MTLVRCVDRAMIVLALYVSVCLTMTTDSNDVHNDGSVHRAMIVLALYVSVCLTMTTDSNDVHNDGSVL